MPVSKGGLECTTYHYVCVYCTDVKKFKSNYGINEECPAREYAVLVSLVRRPGKLWKKIVPEHLTFNPC